MEGVCDCLPSSRQDDVSPQPFRFFFGGDTGYRTVPRGFVDAPGARETLPACPVFRTIGELCPVCLLLLDLGCDWRHQAKCSARLIWQPCLSARILLVGSCPLSTVIPLMQWRFTATFGHGSRLACIGVSHPEFPNNLFALRWYTAVDCECCCAQEPSC